MRLCALDGISGHEDGVRAFCREMAAPYADEIREDSIGNLLCFKKGGRATASPPMLCAHMDEVGLMVKRVTDEGFLKFGTVGAVDPRLLPGKRVRHGDMFGVIGLPPIHLSRPGEKDKAPEVRELLIDIGAFSREDALRRIEPGDVFAFDTAPEEMGNGFFKGKAIDDRLGCAVLLRLLASELPVDTWFVFTVQEEVGTRGAFSAAYALDPSVALVIEGTTAADMPGLDGTDRVSAAGEGVVLSYRDGGAGYDHAVFLAMRDLCEKVGIPYQLKRAVAGGTDGSAIQRSRGGVRIAGLSAAVRYIHAPASLVSLRDAEDVYRAAKLFLENCGAWM